MRIRVPVPSTLLFEIAVPYANDEDAIPSTPSWFSRGNAVGRACLGGRGVFVATFLLAMFLQLQHLHPALPGGDSGELMACCRWLLLAHPPGFPLYITLCHYSSRVVLQIMEMVSASSFFALFLRLFVASPAVGRDPLMTAALFGGARDGGGAQSEGLSWVTAMHLVSAVCHALAAAVLAVIVLRARPTLNPSSLWSGISASGKEAILGRLQRGRGEPSTAALPIPATGVATTIGIAIPPSPPLKGTGRKGVTQVAVLAGLPTAAVVEEETRYSMLGEVALHGIAIVSGLAWVGMKGVLPYGTQTEVFALNNLFVACVLCLWVREESVYALNCAAMSVRPFVAVSSSRLRRKGPRSHSSTASVKDLHVPTPFSPPPPLSVALPVTRQLAMDEGRPHTSTCGAMPLSTVTDAAAVVPSSPTHAMAHCNATAPPTPANPPSKGAPACVGEGPAAVGTCLALSREDVLAVPKEVGDGPIPVLCPSEPSTPLGPKEGRARSGRGGSALPPLVGCVDRVVGPPLLKASLPPLSPATNHPLVPSAGGGGSSAKPSVGRQPVATATTASLPPVYAPRFSTPLSMYVWWACLAAAAMCHQHAILFVVLPVLIRVLYLHVMCGARHRAVTGLLLLSSLLLALLLCLLGYYLLVSRVLDRTHVASWGFADEVMGTSTVARQPHRPSYVSVWRHFVRSDYGTFKLHSGRGGLTVGLGWGVFAHRMSVAGDWALQNIPWYVWLVHLGFLCFALLDVCTRGCARLIRCAGAVRREYQKRVGANSGLPVPARRKAAGGTPRGGSATPTRSLRGHARGISSGSQTPTTPAVSIAGASSRPSSGLGAGSGGETPRSGVGRGGLLQALSQGGRLTSRASCDSFGLFTPTPSATPTAIVRDFNEAMLSVSSANAVNSATPKEAGVDADGMTHCEAALSFSAAGLPSQVIADHLPPMALHEATVLFNTRVRVWSMIFGIVSIVAFNAMGNIDISDVDAASNHVAVHVYQRFWLQSLLPFVLSIGVGVMRGVSILMGVSSMRGASRQTAVLVILFCGFAIYSLCPIAMLIHGSSVADDNPLPLPIRNGPPPSSAGSHLPQGGWSDGVVEALIVQEEEPSCIDMRYANAEEKRRQQRSSRSGRRVGKKRNHHSGAGDEKEAAADSAMYYPFEGPLHEYLGTYRANLSLVLAAYGRSAIDSIPRNGIVVTSGDQHLTAFRYQQYVLGHRRDVVHIDRELAHYAWYRDALERHYGVRIKSPAAEPLLRSLLKRPPMVQIDGSAEGLSKKKRGTDRATGKAPRRLFALEDASLTASSGDNWRLIATPIYNGWFYEVVSNTDPSVREQLCAGVPVSGGSSDGDMDVPMSDFEVRYLIPELGLADGRGGGRTVERQRSPRAVSRAVYSHPMLTLAAPSHSPSGDALGGDPEGNTTATDASLSDASWQLVPFFGRYCPRQHGVVSLYYPWEAAVLQHYALSIKNGLLAEAVRVESGCSTASSIKKKGAASVEGEATRKKRSGSASVSVHDPTTLLFELAAKANDVLIPSHYGKAAWKSAVTPLLDALAQFL